MVRVVIRSRCSQRAPSIIAGFLPPGDLAMQTVPTWNDIATAEDPWEEAHGGPRPAIYRETLRPQRHAEWQAQD
jgi:hypothetical protein